MTNNVVNPVVPMMKVLTAKVVTLGNVEEGYKTWIQLAAAYTITKVLSTLVRGAAREVLGETYGGALWGGP